MTVGALIFAFDNECIDYVSMARWSAERIHRHLGIATTIVTDQDIEPGVFDQVIQVTRSDHHGHRFFADLDQSVSWHNLDRCDAFDLSPYDRTLLIDADYVIASSVLRPLLDSKELLCFGSAHTVGTPQRITTFGRSRFAMWWATACMFGRDSVAGYVFGTMRMIRDNWQHYRDLYQIDSALFRNDYALSMALSLVNGHVQPATHQIPGSMLNLLPDHRLSQQAPDAFRVDYTNSRGVPLRCVIQDQDFHAMCKSELGAVIAAH